MKIINNNDLNIKNVDQKVELYGWINKKRELGKLVFIDLRDLSGLVQLIIKNEMIKDTLTKESVIKVRGMVQKRLEKNDNMASGEIEIQVESYELLSQSNQLPFEIDSEIIPKEDLRLEYRYLDLRRKTMKENIVLRDKVSQIIRDFFTTRDFLNIETPILGRLTPEGARDYIVPTRNKDYFFALPQSPQIYKQILMASGFERYYQLARAFRDEDARKDRQPEFTQLDVEMSFINEKDIIKLTSEFFQTLFKRLNIKIDKEIPLMNYDDALENYGSDKPDLRFENRIIDIKKQLKNSEFKIFQSAEDVRMLVFDQSITKKEFKIFKEIVKKNKTSGLLYAAYDSEKKEGSLFNFVSEEIDNLIQKHSEFNNLKAATVFVVAGEKEGVLTALGAVRVKFSEIKNIKFTKEFALTWVVNWPLFEYSEIENRYLSAHHPFTKPSKESEESFDKDLKNARARAYDIVLNGYEIGGGSIRINDFKMQERIFSALGFNQKQIEDNFGFFLKIFDYGLPPHGGIALGFDRLVSVLANTQSIRDVIAFPKNSKGFDLMSLAPNKINAKLLDELFLKVKK